jgi:hypothetical protein
VVEIWGQVFSGIAMAALLVASGAPLATLRGSREQSQTWKGLSDWSWRAGVAIGCAALLAGAIMRGIATATRTSSGWLPLSSVGDRATLMALLGCILYLGSEWQNFIHPLQRPTGWAGLIPTIVTVGISALAWPVEKASAPVLLVCTLVSAGLGLWSSGQGLNVLVKEKTDNQWAAAAAFAGLTVNVVLVGGVNWRVWGIPSGAGVAGTSFVSGFLSLSAVWLISAARQVWQHSSVRLTSSLDLLATALLVGIALSIQWVWPLS